MRDVPMPQFRMMILPLTAALLLTIAGCSKSPDTDSAKASAAESADADHAESGEADHAEGTEGHAGEGAEGEAAAPVIMTPPRSRPPVSACRPCSRPRSARSCARPAKCSTTPMARP